MRPHSIVIDADASPSGYVAWYNHYSDASKIRIVRPATKNERFGVQRMEMLAVYFALADNLIDIKKAARQSRSRRVLIAVRSDSKSTVDQLLGISAIRDSLMRRISLVIGKLLAKIRCTITFDHLQRSRNIAGLMIEQKRRKEREAELMIPRRVELPVASGILQLQQALCA
ncbi:MAG TPA: hypothetical protein VLA68_04590 [Nitrososphaera sp.]|nr:hypothetical protein [Nitrososphaera sp.]